MKAIRPRGRHKSQRGKMFYLTQAWKARINAISALETSIGKSEIELYRNSAKFKTSYPNQTLHEFLRKMPLDIFDKNDKLYIKINDKCIQIWANVFGALLPDDPDKVRNKMRALCPKYSYNILVTTCDYDIYGKNCRIVALTAKHRTDENYRPCYSFLYMLNDLKAKLKEAGLKGIEFIPIIEPPGFHFELNESKKNVKVNRKRPINSLKEANDEEVKNVKLSLSKRRKIDGKEEKVVNMAGESEINQAKKKLKQIGYKEGMERDIELINKQLRDELVRIKMERDRFESENKQLRQQLGQMEIERDGYKLRAEQMLEVIDDKEKESVDVAEELEINQPKKKFRQMGKERDDVGRQMRYRCEERIEREMECKMEMLG